MSDGPYFFPLDPEKDASLIERATRNVQRAQRRDFLAALRERQQMKTYLAVEVAWLASLILLALTFAVLA